MFLSSKKRKHNEMKKLHQLLSEAEKQGVENVSSKSMEQFGAAKPATVNSFITEYRGLTMLFLTVSIGKKMNFFIKVESGDETVNHLTVATLKTGMEEIKWHHEGKFIEPIKEVHEVLIPFLEQEIEAKRRQNEAVEFEKKLALETEKKETLSRVIKKLDKKVTN